MEREQTLAMIKSFVMKGLVPVRGKEKYVFSGIFVNCFEHAFLNLTNSQLDEIDAGPKTKNIFGNLSEDASSDAGICAELLEKKMYALASEIGLKIVTAGIKPLKPAKNQWQIALYLSGLGNWHFVLQERDGTWSAKEGWTQKTSNFDSLPEYYNGAMVKDYEDDDFKLPLFMIPKFEKYYIVTNPYAESE